MAVGDFTKEECDVVREAVIEVFDYAIPRNKKLNYIGHLNEILCFIAAAKKVAPNE